MRKRLTTQAILEQLETARRLQSASMKSSRLEVPQEEATMMSAEIWETLSSILPDAQERRLAYLLFHCGMSAEEIVRRCSQEFSDIREVYRLRRIIIHTVLRNADRFSRWFAPNEERL